MPLETIRTDQALSVISLPLPVTETSHHYAFLPERLETTSEPFFLVEEVGSECVQSLKTIPTVSDVAHERFEPLLDFAFSLDQDLFPDLGMGSATQLLSGLPEEDKANLVDDDMDGSAGMGFKSLAPTLDAAREMFSQDVQVKAVAEETGKASGRRTTTPKGKKPGSSRGKKGDQAPTINADAPSRLPISSYDPEAAQRAQDQQKEQTRQQLTRRLADGVFNISSREDKSMYIPPLVWPFVAAEEPRPQTASTAP